VFTKFWMENTILGGRNDILKYNMFDGLITVVTKANQIALDTMVIVLTAHGSMESAIEAQLHAAHDLAPKYWIHL